MIRDTISHSVGSYPSEAHGGGWEGFGEDGWEPTLLSVITEMEIIISSGSILKTVMNLNIY